MAEELLQQTDILIVEDEPKIAQLLIDYVQKAGYSSHWLDNGLEVEPWLAQQMPQLILLDLMLPGKDGIAICREIRRFSQVPVIMLTARVEEVDRLLGLEIGADDYICKPFSPREVVARIKTILRRVENQQQPAQHYRGIELDEKRFQVSVNGHRLELTPVEFRLLKVMNDHPGQVFSREQLMSRAYDDRRVVSDRTVDSHIKNLRKKLNDACGDNDLIHSVYGIGYKLE